MKPIPYVPNPVWLIRGGGSGGSGGGTVTIEPYDGNDPRVLGEKLGEFPSILDWGADRTGGSDSSDNIQEAIDEVNAAGGGFLFVPKGDYALEHPIDMKDGVYLRGEGPESKLFRSAELPDGEGLINVDANHTGLIDLQIDGQVTTPAHLNYLTDFITSGNADPMHLALTKNTSVWMHGGSHFRMLGCLVTHTGGYSVLLDARGADLHDVIVERCLFENNRPHLFGVATGDLNYGSWTGGIHYQGDGSTHCLSDALFQNNRFSRCTGNCIWGHLYAFAKLHRNIRHIGNHFEDFGLDGILVGGVDGGTAAGNTFRRGGFIALADSGASTPKYLTDFYAVGLDTSGIVQNVPYTGNSFVSMNGACMDLDGYSTGAITGNVCWMPEPGTAEYSEDGLAASGPGGTGNNWTYGCQISNTSATMDGGRGVEISGNTFRNMGGGAILLACSRGCHVSGNDIRHPAVPNRAPVWILNKGADEALRSFDNVIESNLFYWPAAYAAVVEISLGNDWVDTEHNHVRNNSALGGCYEFERHDSSGSYTDLVVSSRAGTLTTRSETRFRRESDADGTDGYLRLIKRVAGAADVIAATLYDSGLLNVSLDGAARTGAISTGPRTTVGIVDSMATGKSAVDAFLAIRNYATGTFTDADANLFDDQWALLRFNRTAGAWEQSLTAVAGARVWTAFSGSGTGGFGPGGVAYADGAGNLTTQPASFAWDATGKKLTVTGDAIGEAAVAVINGFVDADGGFHTLSTSASAINALLGGVQARYLAASESITVVGIPTISAPPGPDVDQGRLFYDSTVDTFKYWDHASGSWKAFGGVVTPGGPNTSVQVNNSGSFAGYSGFTYNDALLVVTAPSLYLTSGAYQSFNSEGSGIIDAMEYRIDSVSPSSATLGKMGAREVRFRQESGDAAAAGSILYRPTGATDQLVMVGAGASGAGKITLNDWVWLPGNIGGESMFAAGSVRSTIGFKGESTSYQAVQAPNGGVYAKSGHFLNYIDVGNSAGAPPLTFGTSFFRNGSLYWDTGGSGSLMVYTPSGWQPLAAGTGGSPTGPTGAVQRNNSGVFLGDAKLVFDGTSLNLGGISSSEGGEIHLLPGTAGQPTIYFDSFGATSPVLRIFSDGASNVQQVQIFGRPSTWGLLINQGYIETSEGFYSTNGSYQVVNIPNGGVYARSGHFLYYTDIGQFAGVPGLTTGTSFFRNGTIYWDTSLNAIRVYTPSGWQSIGTGSASSPGGSTYYIQVNAGGVFGGYPTLMYDYSIQQFSCSHTDTSYVGMHIQSSGVVLQIASMGSTRRSLLIDHQIVNANAIEVYTRPDGTTPELVFRVAPGGSTWSKGFRATSDNFAGSSATEGTYSARTIRFRQESGDSAEAGTIQNRPTFAGASLAIVGAGATQRRVVLYDWLQFPSSIGGESISAAGWIAANGGFQTIATSYQAIQAPSGGVYALSGHFFNYVDPGQGSSAPTIPTSGAAFRNGTIYWDTTLAALRVLTSGGWQSLAIGGGSTPIGPQWAVQQNNAGSLYGTAHLTYDQYTLLVGSNTTVGGRIELEHGTSQSFNLFIDIASEPPIFRMYSDRTSNYAIVQIFGWPSTAGIQLLNGWVDSAGGFFSALSGSAEVVKIPSGGITARSGHFSVYTSIGSNFGTPSATGGVAFTNGTLYYNTSDNQIYYYRAGVWTVMGLPNPFTLSGAISSTASGAAFYAPNGYAQAKGFNSVGTSANYDSIQTDGGMRASLGYWVNTIQCINASGQFVGAGVSCPSYGVGAASLAVWSGGGWNFGASYPNIPLGTGNKLIVVGGLITYHGA